MKRYNFGLLMLFFFDRICYNKQNACMNNHSFGERGYGRETDRRACGGRRHSKGEKEKAKIEEKKVSYCTYPYADSSIGSGGISLL
ncbi:MAG: hypothetical protein HFH97_08730 [Lachnospiraceae bacterium]|nr:hypothetical protein [uncultured Acetatifactor sp.]MCI9232385.1 hypothetical protein [Lachnospiraceae bacterium]MCI9572680.1 hypothetical protein [Lachnospiraceae bacterium]